jgi:hypothetical protein
MNEFVQRHGSSVIGVLSGWDRMLFRGTYRMLATARGLMNYLWKVQVKLKEFSGWSQALTEQIRRQSEDVMKRANRPLVYLNDPAASKEDLARSIASRDRIEQGPVCLLSCVEPCWSYELHRNRQKQELELVSRRRKCLHLYHYWMHEEFGLMHARLQTWLPLNMKLCLNGREWLCRSLQREGIEYRRRENCLTWVEDVEWAQKLLEKQLNTDWLKRLNEMAQRVSPASAALLKWGDEPLSPYWSVDQSEWATDVMFRSPAALSALYPKLIRQGITTMQSQAVMRFLGRRVNQDGSVPARFAGEVVSDLRSRPEGMRLKHSMSGNSVKMYDKQGSVLRVETTINDARQFKVYRATEQNPRKKAWQRMRKGVADLHRRAMVSDACNQRYLSALGAMECGKTLEEAVRPQCKPVWHKNRRFRAIRPLEAPDAGLLQAVAQGQFAINGFRNRDIRSELFGPDPADQPQTRRRASAVSRQLAMLRAHGLIRKVSRTHRWMLTQTGRQFVTLTQAAKSADAQKLLKQAA